MTEHYLSRLNQARTKSEPADSLWKRFRLWVWSGWLNVLSLAAEASWKQWLGVLFLVLFAIFIYLAVPPEESPEYGIDHDFAIESQEFLSTIVGATDSPFLEGNSVEILSNGDQFYPRMLQAINEAKHSITIEAYIYWEGDIGREFAAALAAKGKEGVRVKVLLDAVGSSSIGRENLQTLESGGCQVAWYHPVFWYTVNRINNRTHRKSLIVDGRIGFTGGAGIADHWRGNAEGPGHWRDTHLRLEGPAVTPLQTAFAHNWLETTGELVSGEQYFPSHTGAGPTAVQSILSSPESGASTVRIMYYLSIVCARKQVLIANPYFVPDEQAVQILSAAEKRGVDVKIMVSGEHNDNSLALANGRRLYGDLLEAGVEIYEYNHTMLHHKYMVCDGIWSTVGTTNFDNRSFALNDENNVCVYDPSFAQQWVGIFEADLHGCQRVELDKWKNRGAGEKLIELGAALFRSQV